MSNACFRFVTTRITSAFRRYGQFVGAHPIPFIILPIVVFGGMGAGLMALDHEKDLEKVYFPRNSRASKDRQHVRNTYPKQKSMSYNAFSQSDKDNAANIIITAKKGMSLSSGPVVSEIGKIVAGVRKLKSSGKTFNDFCAKSRGQCFVDGEYVLNATFRRALVSGAVTYPVWNSIFLFTSISGLTLERGKVASATVVRISFKLVEDVLDWKEKFLEYAENIKPINVDLAYEVPESLSDELDKSTKGDIVFFSLTMTVCCIYASLVTSGGNPVSSRSMLAFSGILAAGLGIVGSIGLLSACGVKFVNIVGVVPFLIIGIGVDDMFLLMSSWSECLPTDPAEQNVQHVPTILGRTLASAGIGITITSVTDLLAFAIGTVSVFLSVTNFSIYAGVAVIFCYLSNVTLFSASLAIHGRRVYSGRHTLTCKVTKPRQELRQEGKSACYALLCGGSPPARGRDDESVCEKFPSHVLPHLFKNKIVNITIIFLFLGYIGISIYGIVFLKQGLILQNLVQDNSYYHKYLIYKDEYFPTRLPIGFYATSEIDYIGKGGTQFENILKEALTDDRVEAKSGRCWLTAFKKTKLFNTTDTAGWVKSLKIFLGFRGDFKADVVFNNNNTKVAFSRCFVLSTPNIDQYANADLMGRMRKLADDSPLHLFAYHWSFVAYEQFVAVLPATMLLVGCAVGVMTVVTFVFLPHPLMVLLVILTIIMILAGIFGFLFFWNLTLSSITMIHLVMSVGFSVDFSAHVCAAYLLSHSVTRQERAREAIRHAAGPILNGATSTMIGVLFLLASKSYIFQSFFKVMFLVIFFGLLHAVFFLPAVLSLVGPENHPPQTNAQESSTEKNASKTEFIETQKPVETSLDEVKDAAVRENEESSTYAESAAGGSPSTLTSTPEASQSTLKSNAEKGSASSSSATAVNPVKGHSRV